MRERKMSKSHAKGVIVLIFSILAIQLVIYLFTLVYKGDFSFKTRNVAKIFNTNTSALNQRNEEVIIKPQRFKFDPNKLSEDGYLKLGFSKSQVNSILKYRSKIGRFKSKKDFAKLYVVSDSLYKELENFIVIEPYVNVNSKISGVSRVKTVNKPNSETTIPKGSNSGEEGTYKGDVREYKSAIKELNKAPKHMVDINSADSLELISLPGIGPYFASKILSYRERLGGYAKAEQLFDIYGIDDQKFEMISSRIIVDTLLLKKIDLSVVNEKELSKHPYIGSYVARGIVRFREKMGSSLISLEELIANKIIKAEFASILRFYCK